MRVTAANPSASAVDRFPVHLQQFEATSSLCKRYARALGAWVKRVGESEAYELMNERCVPDGIKNATENWTQTPTTERTTKKAAGELRSGVKLFRVGVLGLAPWSQTPAAHRRSKKTTKILTQRSTSGASQWPWSKPEQWNPRYVQNLRNVGRLSKIWFSVGPQGRLQNPLYKQ